MESRYIALGGTRRAYYDLARRQVISRRQYLKRHGIFPAGGPHRASGGATHKPVHPATEPYQPYVKQVALPHDIIAEVRPRTASCFDVYIQHVHVVPLNLVQCGKRHRWHCGMGGCSYTYDNLRQMALHCYEAHYLAVCQLAGVASSPIFAVHEIHAVERRSRMPWRVEAPELNR